MALFRGVCDLTAQSAFKLGGMMPPDQRDAVNPCGACRGLPPLFASHGGRTGCCRGATAKGWRSCGEKEEPFPI
ncbi:MAG: hypothetical protein ACLT38_06655 [Akkermansia sp.]